MRKKLDTFHDVAGVLLLVAPYALLLLAGVALGIHALLS